MPVEIRRLRRANDAAWRGLWADYLKYHQTYVSISALASAFLHIIHTAICENYRTHPTHNGLITP